MNRKLTVVLPCFGKPERTKRMIECFKAQTLSGWEAFIIGDGCPDFAKMIKEVWYNDFIKAMSQKGNKIHTVAFERNFGGYGYQAINYAISRACGEFFIFTGNDDVITSTHFQDYLAGINSTDSDFAYFNTWVHPLKMMRMSQLMHGSIGHSELIIRTAFLKRMPPHDDQYGHDWRLIENMQHSSAKHHKIKNNVATYFVMSVKGKTNDTIN